MNPFIAVAALHRPTFPDRTFSPLGIGKDWARVRMNLATHQNEKKKNTGKKEAEETRQATDFNKTECCSTTLLLLFREQHGKKIVGCG